MPEIEMLKTYNAEQIKKLNLEELQTKFLELQEIAKDGNIIIQKQQVAIDILQNKNERLLELCMFALLPKKIYEHELADKTKEAFKNIIKQNINEDTHTIRNEIVRYWDDKK